MTFSLSCYDCDAGIEIASKEEAILKGWTELQEDDGIAWTWLGLCPECEAIRKEEEAQLLAGIRERRLAKRRERYKAAKAAQDDR